MSVDKNDSEHVYEIDKEEVNYLQSELEDGLESNDVTVRDHYLLCAIGFVPFLISTLWFLSN